MPKPFEPNKPEEQVTVDISKREWNMLQFIRQVAYGQVVVHKLRSLIIRVESTNSIIIEEDMVILPKKSV